MDKHKHLIPKLFNSYISEKPIENCVICEKYLLEEGTDYFIEKVFKDDFVEIEYAICMDCTENMKGAMSQQSMLNIENYFRSNMSMMHRWTIDWEDDDFNPEAFLSHCAIRKTPREELKEYQIAGFFNGPYLNPMAPPFLISGAVAEEVNELLSKETKGEIDGFVDDLTGLPPEWKEIFKTRRPILI